MPDVVVIGAGIAGLTAARSISRELPAARVIVVEREPDVGGKLCTQELAGVPFEFGADTFLARVPEGVELARAVGLGDDLVAPATSSAQVLAGGRLHPLPAGTVFGVPVRPRPVARSGVLSHRGRWKVRRGQRRSMPPLTGDVAVGAYVTKLVGREVVERLVDPLLGGVYAGNADALSLRATLPKVAAAAEECGHVLRRLAAQTTDEAGPVFYSIRGGIGRLAAAVRDDTRGAEWVMGARAAALERVGRAWRVTLAGGRAIVCDAVVVALPAHAASTLLQVVAPRAAAMLAGVEHADIALAALAYRPADVPRLPAGSGVLVAAGEKRTIKAVTFAGQKWAHHSHDNLVLMRASAGRAGEPATTDDTELVRAVRRDLRDVLGIRAVPVEAAVARWAKGLPQYAVGHLDLVASIEREIDPLPGLALAGATYRGVGIPACIRSGTEAAARVVTAFRDGTMTA